jgi:hypothetical protein
VNLLKEFRMSTLLTNPYAKKGRPDAPPPAAPAVVVNPYSKKPAAPAAPSLPGHIVTEPIRHIPDGVNPTYRADQTPEQATTEIPPASDARERYLVTANIVQPPDPLLASLSRGKKKPVNRGRTLLGS